MEACRSCGESKEEYDFSLCCECNGKFCDDCGSLDDLNWDDEGDNFICHICRRRR